MDNQKEDPRPKLSPGDRELAKTFSALIKLKEDRKKALCAWFNNGIAQIEQRKQMALRKIERTRQILDSENPDPPMRPGASNLSVPLLMTEHSAIAATIRRNIFGHKPPVKIKLAGGVRELESSIDGTKEDLTGPLNRFSMFLDGQLRNTRMLNAEATVGTVASTQCSDGTGQWVVVATPPLQEIMLGPDGNPIKTWTPGTVQWMPLRFEDTIFYNGYGTNFTKMPFCGFYAYKRWTDIKAWGEHGYYDKEAVDKVKAFYEKESGNVSDDDRPCDQRVHKVAELYLAYDTEGDGWLRQIVCDYHVEADVILRVSWNKLGRYRPIVGAQYDLPAKTNDYLGSGLGTKLDGVQTEVSMIHNLGIESGKRGIANILVGKENTGIDDELGGDEVVMPGDYYATDDPKEDLLSIPLGDPRAVEAALMLEGVGQSYAQRVTGRDEGSQGQVSAAKRVSPKVGVPIMREGRTARENATSNLGAAMQEAIFITLQYWQFQKPERQYVNILEKADVPIINSMVLAPQTPDSDVRDRVVVNVVARDVAATEEQRQQKLMLMNQFIVTWYSTIREMLTQILAAYGNPQTIQFAEPLRKIHMQIIQKLRNSVEEMLRTSEEVEDPEDYLIEMEDIKMALDQAANAASMPQQMAAPGGAPAQQQPTLPETGVDLGGGVA